MDRRIVFFPEGTPPALRRRRLIFLAIWIGVAAMITWPGFVPFAAASPLVLGLPSSLAWIVLAVLVIFFALLWLYRGEPDTDGEVITVDRGKGD